LKNGHPALAGAEIANINEQTRAKRSTEHLSQKHGWAIGKTLSHFRSSADAIMVGIARAVWMVQH